MKRLPRHVDVLGVRYEVRRDRKLLKQGLDGLCLKQDKRILVAHWLRGDPMWAVFYHEMAHALAYESGMSDFMHPAAEEMFAQAFANTVLSLPLRF